MRDIGDTELIGVVKRLIEGKSSLEELQQVVDSRPSAVNLPNVKGLTPLHLLAQSSTFSERGAAIRILVEAGANAYLASPSGDTAVDLAPEGAQREEMVASILAHRLAHEGEIKSVAPLSASRLMKRAGDDTGTGVFSNVAKHCLYFSYKGAIFLWDVVHDVEHTIYQPREHHAQWTRVDGQLHQFERKRSFVSHGGLDPSFDPTTGDALSKQIKAIESQIPLVTNFTLVCGLEAQKDPLSTSGVSEWVLCNTGAMIEVRLDRNGPKLRPGRSQSIGRRRSQVCGGSAEYPEGLVTHVSIYQNGGIRFSKRPDAGQVCCAVDGLYGTVGYVVAAKSASRRSLNSQGSTTTGTLSPTLLQANNVKFGDFQELAGRSPPTISPREGFAYHQTNIDGATFLDAFASQPSAPPSRGLVSFFDDATSQHSNNNLNNSSRHATPNSREGGRDQLSSPSPVQPYASPSDGVVFRVVEFRMMHPKDGFDHAMKSLTDKRDPFCETTVSERKIPLEECGEAICVQQCRVEFMLLLTSKKLYAADVNPKKRHSKSEDGGYTASFFEFPNVKPIGNEPFQQLAALAPQRFRTIKPNHMRYFFVVTSSEALSLYELDEDRTASMVFRIYPDRIQPQRFTPLFHPSENTLLILYQSLLRQEVCTYDLITQRMQSVCKLPKPSSLRFYTQPTADEVKLRKKLKRQGLATDPDPEVAHLNFALSGDGVHLLRYNVTMHVMSIYSWEEIHVRSETASYVNTSFIREPLPVADPRLDGAMSRLASRESIRGSTCVWIVAECLDIQEYQRERGMTVLNTTIPEGEEDPDLVRRADCRYVDQFITAVREVFSRVASTFGGKVVPYAPAPFSFTASPEEEYDDEELQQMEQEYFGNMPRHHGVWTANVVSPLEAVRCCIKIVREMLRAPWDAETILSQEKYAPKKLEYKPKTLLEKRFPKEPDPEATVWLNRGPRLRLYVCGGETTTPVDTLHENIDKLVTHDCDGVIIIDPGLQRVLKPLRAFYSSEPVPEIQIGAAAVAVPPELSEWIVR